MPPGKPPQRKLLRRQESPHAPKVRFITFSCVRRLPLFQGERGAMVQADFADLLAAARRRHRFELFAWVVMPEHVHLLIRPAANSVWSTIASAIKNESAKRGLATLREHESPLLDEAKDSRGRPRFWQPGGGFDRNVRGMTEFTRNVRYIHRNPVERGLVPEPHLWRSSSVRWWMGRRDGEVECDPPPGRPEMWAGWRGYL